MKAPPHSKFWANIGLATATLIVIKEAFAATLTVDLFGIYLFITTGYHVVNTRWGHSPGDDHVQ
jgi:hypothetical protein